MLHMIFENDFLIDNFFVRLGGGAGHQEIGNPNGANCAPLLDGLFLYSYDDEFLDNMIESCHERLAKLFILCYRYIDHFTVFKNRC